MPSLNSSSGTARSHGWLSTDSSMKTPVFKSVSAPENRPCSPEDGVLTPGIGYCITPFPSFLDRPGIENRVHFSYAFNRRETVLYRFMDESTHALPDTQEFKADFGRNTVSLKRVVGVPGQRFSGWVQFELIAGKLHLTTGQSSFAVDCRQPGRNSRDHPIQDDGAQLRNDGLKRPERIREKNLRCSGKALPARFLVINAAVATHPLLVNT